MLKLSLDLNIFNSSYYFYERLIVILFSLIPSLILVFYVLYSDRRDREPFKNIIICLLSGILTIALSNYFEGMLQNYLSESVLLTYLFALIEEISKISIFMLFIFDNKFYDDIYDGVVYMALIALSFAGLENIMYAFSESTINDSINLALLRDFTTIPLHVICGIVIGHFMSLSNFSKNKAKKYINFIKAILYSSLIHAAFNIIMNILGDIKIDEKDFLSVMIKQTFPIILIMIILYVIATKIIKSNRKLNKVFISNIEYNSKYNYLMKKNEYYDSYNRVKRFNMYKKTKIKKEEKNNSEDDKIKDMVEDIFANKDILNDKKDDFNDE